MKDKKRKGEKEFRPDHDSPSPLLSFFLMDSLTHSFASQEIGLFDSQPLLIAHAFIYRVSQGPALTSMQEGGIQTFGIDWYGANKHPSLTKNDRNHRSNIGA